MNTPAIETDVLCHVFELQAEIIRKQAIVIEQSNIGFDNECIAVSKKKPMRN